MSDVVTGEAVVVEVRVARLATRAGALLIDMAVQVGLMWVAGIVLANLTVRFDAALVGGVWVLLTALVLVGYPVIFESLTRGRSLGKLALGLRVVGDDGGPERFRQALFRGLAGVVEIWMLSGAGALICSLVSERGKRLGDVFAGTLVISERAPRAASAPIVMPPQLAAWAQGLELSRLPVEMADTARQYLTRWHDLAPGVREEMGARISAQMAAFVSPPPPAGVPAHAYLSAVLAERRRREEVRLARRAAESTRSRGAVPSSPASYPVTPPPSGSPAAAPPPKDGAGEGPRVTPGGFVPPA